MSVSSESCLFCTGPLTGLRSKEHLIPAAIGGELTTDRVCVECNSVLGSTVDKFVDHPLFLALRSEVGLSVHRQPEWEFDDPVLGAKVRARRTADGFVELLSPVHSSEGRVVVRADTEEKMGEIARKVAARLEREGKSVEWRELEQHEPVWVRGHIPLQDASGLTELLGREAAKIAIEYVARVAGPEMALVHELDGLREHARHGPEFAGIQVAYVGPRPPVRLPRLDEVHVLGRDLPRQAKLDQMIEELVPQPPGGAKPDPSQVAAWPGFEHRVELIRGAAGPRFQLTLFSCLVVAVPLPGSLADLLPWGCFDSKDLRTGEVQRDHPWGEPPRALG